VRLFHHDSVWVNPNIFGDKDEINNTRNLSASSKDSLDWWIKCLKEEGIYIWLDLHVRRNLLAGDGIYAFDEIDKKTRRQGAEFRGYNYVNASIRDAMKKFNTDYLTHVNRYTELAYKDDPAIIGMIRSTKSPVSVRSM